MNSEQNINKHIRKYLAEHPEITQEEFAQKVNVSRQTLAGWITKNQPSIPRTDQLPAIAQAMNTTISLLFTDRNSEEWTVKDQMYQADHMYTRLRTYAETEGLNQFHKALSYAKELHKNETRDPNRFGSGTAIPYIVHPLMMACHAHALGIKDDEVLTAIMLHDVCEDCGVTPEELPFSESVKEIVALLTKDKDHEHDPGYDEAYYTAIMHNSKATIVKALDRCNNVSTMAGSFDKERLTKYIKETETYVYPLLDYCKENYPQYSNAIFVIKYQIMSILETIKSMLMCNGN